MTNSDPYTDTGRAAAEAGLLWPFNKGGKVSSILEAMTLNTWEVEVDANGSDTVTLTATAPDLDSFEPRSIDVAKVEVRFYAIAGTVYFNNAFSYRVLSTGVVSTTGASLKMREVKDLLLTRSPRARFLAQAEKDARAARREEARTAYEAEEDGTTRRRLREALDHERSKVVATVAKFRGETTERFTYALSARFSDVVAAEAVIGLIDETLRLEGAPSSLNAEGRRERYIKEDATTWRALSLEEAVIYVSAGASKAVLGSIGHHGSSNADRQTITAAWAEGAANFIDAFHPLGERRGSLILEGETYGVPLADVFTLMANPASVRTPH